MTRQKSFKSRVRARMAKTGESYTAARRQLIAAESFPVTVAETVTPAAPEPRNAPGGTRRLTSVMTDATLRDRTGRAWSEWFALLDAWDATARTHREIARWLVAEHGLDEWWTQTVTVGYEQERGMRAPAQLSDGEFVAAASKTVAVSAVRVTEAFQDPDLRAKWLPGAALTVRTVREGRSLTADWAEGGRLSVYLTAKGEAKCQVGVQHLRLADAETADELKTFWRAALTDLKKVLEG